MKKFYVKFYINYVLICSILIFLTACDLDQLICSPLDIGGQQIVCSDGNSVELCLSPSLSECGVQVGSEFFDCESCNPLSCDEGTEAAVDYCLSGSNRYNSIPYDESPDSDNDVIYEMTELFRDALENYDY